MKPFHGARLKEMTAFQSGETVIFLAFFTENHVGKAGLTDVTVTIHHETAAASDLVVNAASCTDVGDGFYKYALTNPPSTAGVLRVRFVTADTTVDAKELVTATPYAQAWTDRIDVAIGSRAVEGSVTVVSPVASGSSLTLFAGADYSEELANEIQFTISTPTDYSGATVTLKIGSAFSKTGVITESTPSQITASFEPTADETAALRLGRTTYQVQVALSGKETVTVRGTCNVEKKL